MPIWTRVALRVVAPLAAAMVLTGLEEPIAALVAARPGTVPVAMVVLLAGLLVGSMRRWMIVVLCYCIAAMAFRDAFHASPLPPQMDLPVIDRLYPLGWALLALLAAVAGTMEAVTPGTVWARRCYFGAAALYLGGHGVISYLTEPNWQAIILMACGAVAVVGAVSAHRIVAAEGPQPPVPPDIVAMNEHIRRRGERIASKEWR